MYFNKRDKLLACQKHEITSSKLATVDAYTTILVEVIDKEPAEFWFDFAIWTGTQRKE